MQIVGAINPRLRAVQRDKLHR